MAPHPQRGPHPRPHIKRHREQGVVGVRTRSRMAGIGEWSDLRRVRVSRLRRPETVTGVNDLATQFPQVAAQWHPTRNEDLIPDRISGGARQKVWWVCEKGHEWQARVSSRTSKGTGCPVCWDHRTVTGSTTLPR